MSSAQWPALEEIWTSLPSATKKSLRELIEAGPESGSEPALVLEPGASEPSPFSERFPLQGGLRLVLSVTDQDGSRRDLIYDERSRSVHEAWQKEDSQAWAELLAVLKPRASARGEWKIREFCSLDPELAATQRQRFIRAQKLTDGLIPSPGVEIFETRLDEGWRLRPLLGTETLRARLARPWNSDDSARWSHQLAMALQASKELRADESGRELAPLSPDHVLVEDGNLRLLSEARLCSEDERIRLWSESPYAAPEQGLQGICNARTDVWALGVILWELSTGQAPATGREALLKMWTEGAPQAPDGEYSELINSCLAREPFARPQPRRIARSLAQRRFASNLRHAPIPRASSWRLILSGLAAAILTALLLWLLVLQPIQAEARHHWILSHLAVDDTAQRRQSLEALIADAASLPRRRDSYQTQLVERLAEPEPELRALVIAALQEQAGSNLARFIESWSRAECRRGIIDLVRSQGLRALPALVEVLEKRSSSLDDCGRFALQMLCSIEPDASTPADLKKRRGSLLLKSFDEPDPSLRATLVDAARKAAKDDPELRQRVALMLQQPQRVETAANLLLSFGTLCREDLIRALTSRSEVVRQSLLKALIERAQQDQELRPMCLELIVRELSDESPALRLCAQQALRNFRDEAVPQLVNALADKSLQPSATALLQSYASPEMAARLLELSTKNQAPREAIEAIVIAYAKAQGVVVQFLIESMKTGDARAERLLGAAGGPAAMPLVAFVRAGPNIEARAAALRAIAAMGIQAAPAGDALTQLARSQPPAGLCQDLFKALSAIAVPPAQRLPVLVEALDHKDPIVQAAARAALGACPSAEAPMIVEHLRMRMASANSEVSELLLEILGPRALEMFAAELDHPEALRRDQARAMLARLVKTEADQDRLISALAQAQGRELGNHLVATQGPRIAAPVTKMLGSEDIALVRRAQEVLQALFQKSGIKALEGPLIEALGAEDFRLRQWSSDTIARFGEPALAPLCAALAHPNTELARSAARCLALIARNEGIDRVEPYLAEALKDPKRRSWALGTYMFTRPESLPFLCRRLKTDDPAIRDAITQTLLTLGSAVFDSCLSLAAESEDDLAQPISSVLSALALRDEKLVSRLVAGLADERQRVPCEMALARLSHHATPSLVDFAGAESTAQRLAVHRLLLSGTPAWSPPLLAIVMKALKDENPKIRLLALTQSASAWTRLTTEARSEALTLLVNEALQQGAEAALREAAKQSLQALLQNESTARPALDRVLEARPDAEDLRRLLAQSPPG